MLTYPDFLEAVNKGQKLEFIWNAISQHRSSDMYKIAADADEYEAQRNVTISNWQKYLYNMNGQKVTDFTSTNTRLANNLFHRLNTQRLAYSLGNGVSFTNKAEDDKDRKEAHV